MSVLEEFKSQIDKMYDFGNDVKPQDFQFVPDFSTLMEEIRALQLEVGKGAHPGRIFARGIHLEFTFEKRVRTKFIVPPITSGSGILQISFGSSTITKPSGADCHRWSTKRGHSHVLVFPHRTWVKVVVQEWEHMMYKATVHLDYRLTTDEPSRDRIIEDLEMAYCELTEPCPENPSKQT